MTNDGDEKVLNKMIHSNIRMLEVRNKVYVDKVNEGK